VLEPQPAGLAGTTKLASRLHHCHIAFKAEPQTYDELKRRLESAGEAYRENNHGYCKSMYVSSLRSLFEHCSIDRCGFPGAKDASSPGNHLFRCSVAVLRRVQSATAP
jgi:hypothetical protein